MIAAGTAEMCLFMRTLHGWMAAGIAEKAFDCLRAPILRVTLPDAPAPSATSEEKAYYPTAQNIVQAVLKIATPSPMPVHAVTVGSE